MTFEAQGRFLRDFISEFGIEKPHLVGPNVGMAAALAYVTHFPNDVASLAIGDGPGIAPSQNGSVINKMVDSGFWRLIFKIAGAGTFVHAANKWAISITFPTKRRSPTTSTRIPVVSARSLLGSKYPESLRYVDPKLEEIDRPVLIFWGAQDKLLLAENAERLKERLQRSKAHIFERCGHFSYQDRHEKFADLITEWVEGGYRRI